MSGIVAYKLIGAIDDHLRGIDAVDAQVGAVLALSLGVLGGGEAVVPAEAVPVVDVFTQHDDLGAIDGLIVVELREESVCGRTAGAALGGK